MPSMTLLSENVDVVWRAAGRRDSEKGRSKKTIGEDIKFQPNNGF
jgi:hypothetical protein